MNLDDFPAPKEGFVITHVLVVADSPRDGSNGGGPPASAEAREQMMAAFQAWAASAGGNMTDPGAPLGPSKVVTSDNVTDGAAGGNLGGYTVISADSLDDAVSVVKGHPFLSRGGTLQVSQAVSP
jgi:hypothetical protein